MIIKILKFILYLFISVGICSIIFIFYIRAYYRGLSNEMIDDLIIVSNMEYNTELVSYENDVTTDAIKETIVEETTTIENSELGLQEDMVVSNQLSDGIALLQIESCNINAIVSEGTGEEQLKYSVGHFEETPMPGEGDNVCLAGHSSVIYDQVLNTLKDIELGAEIKVVTSDKTYIYYTYSIDVVNPEDVWVLNRVGREQLTIITCTDNGARRLRVIARPMNTLELQQFLGIETEEDIILNCNDRAYSRLITNVMGYLGSYGLLNPVTYSEHLVKNIVDERNDIDKTIKLGKNGLSYNRLFKGYGNFCTEIDIGYYKEDKETLIEKFKFNGVIQFEKGDY